MAPQFRPLPIIDSHIHYSHPSLKDGLLQVLDDHGVGRGCIVCTPHPTRLSLTPDALHLKAQAPGRIYVFGGLDISPFFTAPQACGQHFARHLDTLIAMGCDGVKMIEGKPDMRKMLQVPPFDGPAYAPYWARLEELGLPLIFHVNDPPEFWDADRLPDWARQQGWFYGDGSFIDNEKQYTEVLTVLRRHPHLKVIFAHFFFLADDLARLGRYLDEFPNMHIDLTPGIEMYHAFARKPQAAQRPTWAARDFFIRYQDRILYGTDIGARALLSAPGEGIEPRESGARIELVRSLLERKGPFRLEAGEGFLFGKFAGEFAGLDLPPEALEKIYHRNFERLAGEKPRPPNPAAIIGECRRLLALIPAMGAARPGEKTDTSVTESVLAYFEGAGR